MDALWFMPFTQNIFMQPMHENSWPFKTFCCGKSSVVDPDGSAFISVRGSSGIKLGEKQSLTTTFFFSI